jgi:hypothetical protein
MTSSKDILLEKSNNLEMMLALEWIGDGENLAYVEAISNNCGNDCNGTIGIRLTSRDAKIRLYNYIKSNT